MIKIARDGQEIGELENTKDVLNEVAIGKVKLTDLFWEPGMDDWRPIRTLPDAEAYAPEAPPIPESQPESSSTPPVEVEEKEQTIPVYPPPKDESISECSRGIYIGLAIFFGALGVHNFYANRTNIAIAQALISILTFWSIVIPICVWIIAIFESVSITRDGEGRVFKGA